MRPLDGFCILFGKDPGVHGANNWLEEECSCGFPFRGDERSLVDFSFEKGKGIKGVRHPDAKVVRTDRWKINYYPDGYAELYDIKHDPGEIKNLHGQHGFEEIERALRDQLLKWLATVGETDQIAPEWLLP